MAQCRYKYTFSRVEHAEIQVYCLFNSTIGMQLLKQCSPRQVTKYRNICAKTNAEVGVHAMKENFSWPIITAKAKLTSQL